MRNNQLAFRVWDNVDEEYVEDIDAFRIDTWGHIVLTDSMERIITHRYSVERCTGALDSNDEPIFQNDILKPYCSDIVQYVVEWRNCGFYLVEYKDGEEINDFHLTPEFAKMCKVVGTTNGWRHWINRKD